MRRPTAASKALPANESGGSYAPSSTIAQPSPAAAKSSVPSNFGYGPPLGSHEIENVRLAPAA